MSSSEFIISQLSLLIKKFQGVMVRYHNDKNNFSHIIEVTPSYIYHKSFEFKSLEESIIGDFINEFPFENIIFLAADDEYKISNVDFELKGSSFDIVHGYIQPTMSYTLELPQYEIAYDSLFESYLPQLQNLYVDAQNKLNNNMLASSHIIHCDFSDNYLKDIFDVKVDTLYPFIEDTKYTASSGQNNYALAA